MGRELQSTEHGQTNAQGTVGQRHGTTVGAVSLTVHRRGWGLLK
jgi:hypothetical protein